MASDAVDLPVEGGPTTVNDPSPIKEMWQRWNDYGIGLFLEGAEKGGQKGELKQAEPVFKKVAELGQADGWVNLARVYQREGRIPDALAALEKAASHQKPSAPWVINWLTGQINDRNGNLDEAIASYESVLATNIPERGFDFSLDFEVLNALATSQYNRARREPLGSPERRERMEKTVATYRRTLRVDSENVAAHYGLGLAYNELARGEVATAAREFTDKEETPVTAELLEKQTARAAEPGVSDRKSRALALWSSVVRFTKAPRPDGGSRLEPLYDIVESIGPAWDLETDPAGRAALALVLETTHRTLHRLLKPDETAEGRAVAIARRNNPAADQNAQSIVIHPLHRPGETATREGGQ
jgi:tetratricopeptide (TPR) repeat protein